MMQEIQNIVGNTPGIVLVSVTDSSGINPAKQLGISFVQAVVAATAAMKFMISKPMW